MGEAASNAPLGAANAHNGTPAHAGGSIGINQGQIYALPAVNASTGQRYFTTQFVPGKRRPMGGAFGRCLAQFRGMATMPTGAQPALGSGNRAFSDSANDRFHRT